MEPKIQEKAWDPKIEEGISASWKGRDIYKFNPDTEKKVFSIDTPPPYPSGTWHVGALAHYTMIDMVARTMRMRGYEVLFPFGLDRNGLPVEVAVEKKHQISMHHTDRAKFIALCEEFLNTVGKEMLEIVERSGMSCSYGKYYTTDSPEYRALTQATFIDMWEKGLVYEDYRPNNWCSVCGTTIADAELEYKEVPSTLNHVKFKVKETGEDLVIATTRPELLCACQCVLIHPEDERYTHLHGKNAVLPIYDRIVPIIPHHYAKPDFGTGAAMICSYGDQTDVKLFRELNLEPVEAIGTDGKMTARAGKYFGMKAEPARKQITEDLGAAGLLAKQEPTMHRTPVCWRSKNAVEFISMNEFYVKQVEFLDDLRKIAEGIKFHPPQVKQILDDWMDAVTIDWPVSRRRFYGTEIPIWYCSKCGKPSLPKPGKYYRPWKEKFPGRCACGSTEFVGETRTFDTWMDSSISELFVTGYKRNEAVFKKAFPCSLRPQGKDIVRTWLFYALLRAHLLLKKPAFRNVWISGMGLDRAGKKMSKSLGNVVFPMPILQKHGADAFRLWAASEVSLGEDYRFDETRVQGAFKFLTKLWNVARFISSFDEPAKKPRRLADTDKWILSELNTLVKGANLGYDEFNFFIPATKAREFVWNVFAPHYVELAKHRAYAGDESAVWTLHECLRTVLKLLAPITPHVTEKIWSEAYSKESIHFEELPRFDPKRDSELSALTQKLVDFDSLVWRQKKEKAMPLNAEISGIEVPKELAPFAEDLKSAHKLK